MSYHLTLLRTSGGVEHPIGVDEVAAACRQDPRWTFDEADGSVTCREDGRELVCLWLGEGTLWTKNPEREAFAPMQALAQALGARIRGDELETYRSIDETYVHPDDAPLLAKLEAESAVRARRARIRHLLFRAFQVISVSIILLAVAKRLLAR